MSGGTQSVGEADLHRVAQLVEHQRRDEAGGKAEDGGVSGEERSERLAKDKEGQGGDDRHGEQNVGAGTRGGTDAAPVAKTVGGSEANAQSGSETVVEEETERADGDHDLKRGEVNGAEPACHDAAHRERTALHSHLKPDGEGLTVNKLHSAFAAAGEEAETIDPITLSAQNDDNQNERHDGTGEQGAQSGTRESHLGKTAMPINQKIVSKNVQRIAAEQCPHPHGGVRDAVGELTQGVEERDEQEGEENGEVVGSNEGKQFRGLSESGEEEIGDSHDSHEQKDKQQVRRHSVAEQCARFAPTSSSVEGADQRRQSVTVAHEEKGDEVENAVDEGSGGKRVRAVASDHHRVGKSHDDDANLSDGDGNAESQNGFVVRKHGGEGSEERVRSLSDKERRGVRKCAV